MSMAARGCSGCSIRRTSIRKASYPGIVVAHGINALAIGIEKYAARFAERGFVAMAFDYQSYGFSIQARTSSCC